LFQKHHIRKRGKYGGKKSLGLNSLGAELEVAGITKGESQTRRGVEPSRTKENF